MLTAHAKPLRELCGADYVNEVAKIFHGYMITTCNHFCKRASATARNYFFGTVRAMTIREAKRMKSQGLRLKAAREAAGYRSGREAALENGWKLSTYSSHEAGRRKMGDDDAEKYARRFNARGVSVTARWILWGDGGEVEPLLLAPPTSLPIELRFAPVRGVAKAGTWIEVDDSMQAEFDPIPYVPTAYKAAEQFAYKISGHSMNRRGIMDGDYVVCIAYFIARAAPTQDDIVVVERRDGQRIELSCKKLVTVGDTYELHPDSTDERFKPIIIPTWDAKETADAMQIEIVGLVIGKYTPI